MKRVFDEPNPFAPEIRKEQFVLAKKKNVPSTSQLKPYQKIKTKLQGMDAYSRHKEFINNYVLYYSGSTKKLQRDTSNDKGIYDVIKDNHRFLWDNDSTSDVQTWEGKLAKKYYDKLFKEYCIADLSQYEKNRIAMRWRIKSEVFSGKGQFECGNKHCNIRDGLSSWEVNFGYIENDIRKNALVKLRLCVDCSAKLNFHSKKRLIKKELKEKKDIEFKTKHKKKSHKSKQIKKEKKSDTSSEESEYESKSNLKIKVEPKEINDQIKNDDEKKQNEASASEIWTDKSALFEAERTIEDEFDEFIDDLLF